MCGLLQKLLFSKQCTFLLQSLVRFNYTRGWQKEIIQPFMSLFDIWMVALTIGNIHENLHKN